MISLLSIGQLRNDEDEIVDQSLIEKSSHYQLLSGRLYKQGNEGVLRLCIESSEISTYLQLAHIDIGMHYGKSGTYRNLMHLGVYWPTMKLDVHELISKCSKCTVKSPVEYSTLFQVTMAPH